jgi:HlyD family secretion protein
MNKKMKIIPIAIVLLCFTVAVVYFDLFRKDFNDKKMLKGSGSIEVTEINISTKIAGKIISIPKEEGEAIEKGDLAVKIDFDEINAQKNSAAANLSNAGKNFARVTELYKTGSISKRDFDNAEAAFIMAKASLDRVSASMENAVIFSPISGIILSKNIEPGETAFPGTPIITIADLSKPWIKIYIPEKHIGFVKLGQNAFIYVDSFPNKPFKGKVTSISNKAEFTPKTIQTKDERVKLMFAVKIVIENKEQSLKPGMPADAEIILENKK